MLLSFYELYGCAKYWVPQSTDAKFLEAESEPSNMVAMLN